MDARAQKLWQRGLVHFRQGNLEAAQAHFEAFLARAPGSGPGRFRLSMVQARRGRHFRAAELAREALAEGDAPAELLAHLARCELAAGNVDEARRAALRGVALPRDNPIVLDALAVVLTRLDEPALALELFDQALALDPGQASIYYNRALARRQFDQCDGAEQDLLTCLALNPQHARASWSLSRLRDPARHLPRLAWRPAFPALDREYLALARFRGFDDAGDRAAAADALLEGIASREARPRPPADWADRLIAAFDERFLRGDGPARSTAAAPIFVVGMPRSGVALIGRILSRHARVQHLGNLGVFGRHLAGALGQDDHAPPATEALLRARDLDLPALGARALEAVQGVGGRPQLLCETRPMNFALVGLIARALPGARFIHARRDPLDTCLSVLAHAGGEASLPSDDPGALAAYYLQYDQLMRHWQRALPGRILDLDYASLVEKPDMVLRVACAFLGIRYGASLRMGLQLHARSIGRGRAYASWLPTLEAGLEPLSRAARSA
jgi:Tfp pilus assembly protein PilF